MRHEPPFDGSKPCPMCPSGLRNLAACAHNLLGCLEGSPQYERIPKKLFRLREALNHDKLKTNHPDVLRLIEVVQKVAAVDDYPELFSLREEFSAAMVPVNVLSDAHFADSMHSHGEMRL